MYMAPEQVEKVIVIPEVTSTGEIREKIITTRVQVPPSSASVVTFAPTIPAVRIAIIGGHAHFVESIAAATRHSQSSALRNVFWTQIQYPSHSTMPLPSFIDESELHGLKAAIIVVDDWINELHTFAAQRCIHYGVPCLVVQSKSDDDLRAITKTSEFGIKAYREFFRADFREQLRSRYSMHLSAVYLINDTSLLLAALGVRDDSIVADERLFLNRLEALAAGDQ